MKKVIKRIVIAVVILATVAVLLPTAAEWIYKKKYGTLSIPSWMRPTHESKPDVKDYHSYLSFEEPENSLLPRIDISMDEDYLLSRTEYTNCFVQISNADEYNLESEKARIRIRGNSTQFADKKPYKICFFEETSLFGGGKERNWVLLANVNDTTGIHNYVSMELARYLMADGTFVPMVQFVNLYINGEYQGVYNLCDQVEPGDKRVPISKEIQATPEETDYLIVNDKYAYYDDNVENKGWSWFWLDKAIAAIEVKSPDTDDIYYSEEYTDYIKKRLEEIYDIILSKDWEAICEAVDVDSVINGFLVSIIADNADIAFKSVYFYLPAEGRLTYGPVWDMDLTFGAGTSKGYRDVFREKSDHNVFWKQLMRVDEFRDRFVRRYQEVYPELEGVLNGIIDEAVDRGGKDLAVEFANRFDWGRYGVQEYKDVQTYEESIAHMKKWIHERLDYLYALYCE